jgi:hypothetical protein
MRLFVCAVFALWPLSGPTATFDCERVLFAAGDPGTSAFTRLQQLDELAGTSVDFETVLGLAAAWLGPARDPFLTSVKEQLTGVRVWNRPQRSFSRLFYARKGVQFGKFLFPTHRSGQLWILGEAIRVAFSNDTADRHLWRSATPQERFRLLLHFQARAVRVLLYQHKLYTQFVQAVGDGDLDLMPGFRPAPAGLRPPQLRRPSMRKGGKLFEEVRLSRELETLIASRLGPDPAVSGSDEPLIDILEHYVQRSFVANFDTLMNTGPGLLRLETLTIFSLIASGAVAAYLGGPWIPPSPHNVVVHGTPEEIRTPSANLPAQSDVAELIRRTQKDLEETAKSRALTEEELLIQEELKVSGMRAPPQ